jgi:hypothetical protein
MTKLPSSYRRNFPEWSPDLIQRFVPYEELNQPERYTQPPSKPRRRRKPPIDPFY